MIISILFLHMYIFKNYYEIGLTQTIENNKFVLVKQFIKISNELHFIRSCRPTRNI